MEKHIHNPFQYGSIVVKDNFCNRKDELKELKGYIKDSYSVWLYSPRRYGKSSLIYKAFSEIKGIKTIYFDLYNVKSLDDFCKKYASLIAKNLFSWDLEIKSLITKFSEYFKNLHPSVSFDESGSPSFSLDINEIQQQYDVERILEIPQRISKSSKNKICIAFDEFQEIDRIEPFLIHWMRSAFQHHTNISYIFMGSQQTLMEMIFTSHKSPFYEFATKMQIDQINDKDWTTFIKHKFKAQGLTITSKNIDAILEKSQGHPHFTQYFASVVFDFIRIGEDQKAANFNALWMEKILRSQSIIFQEIYDQLTNIQRTVVSTIAHLPKDVELFSSATKHKYKLPANSSIVSAIESLTKKGLIIKRTNKYQLLNPIFKEWILSLN